MDNPPVVRQTILNWLLEEENPSVRYFTLRDLLGLPQDDNQVRQAEVDIMQRGAVSKILSRQKPDGYWGKPEDFYVRSKYKGTVWSFILLAELGVDGRDERIKRATEFLLKTSQDPQSGGFAYQGSLAQGGEHMGVIPCLSGNMVWSMLRFGYGDDPRVAKGVEWLAASLRCDDKESAAPNVWPYTVKEGCWGKHTCMMTVVKTLKALAEIPIENRTPQVQQALEMGEEFILRHHLFKRSHNLAKIAKPSWVEFGFPWFWLTDALEMLLLLRKLDCRDERAGEAIDLLLSKQNDQGQWILEHSFNGRMMDTIETEGEPSKWVTLNALKVLIWQNRMSIVNNYRD